MSSQHIIERDPTTEEGIRVPLDLPGMHILRQKGGPQGVIAVEIMATSPQATCPRCHHVSVKIHDIRKRKKRDLALREHPVELVLLKRRFKCFSCHKPFTEQDTVCGWRKRTTARLRETIGQQASMQPVAHVAAAFEVGPRFVQTCLEAMATVKIEQQGRSLDERCPLPTPRYLGIDEFARRKGHHYETILCDLVSHTVLEISEGRKLQEVQHLLERLTHPDAVEAVSMDMSASFRPAVQLCLPKAQIIVDHFHVIQHVMKALKKIVSSWAHKKEGKTLLQGKQHLFLMAQQDLTETQAQERSQIGQALPLLEAAWQIKEALRTWYATATATTAAAELDRWIEQVQNSGLDPFRQALSAFVNWRQEILAFFQFLPTRLSNGFGEGKNNRTKALMRQAYGYRNRRHLRLRILLDNAR